MSRVVTRSINDQTGLRCLDLVQTRRDGTFGWNAGATPRTRTGGAWYSARWMRSTARARPCGMRGAGWHGWNRRT